MDIEIIKKEMENQNLGIRYDVQFNYKAYIYTII